MYPEYALIDGKRYKINTGYKTALKCFDVIEDTSITGQERALAVIYLLFGFIPDTNFTEFLEKAKIFLQCGETEEEQSSKKKDMDFRQDRGYLYASFVSDYMIDLEKEDIHFWAYIDLIKGLTEDSALNRVRAIRNYDLSTVKDTKEKQKIIEAKKQVALKENRVKTKEEERLDKLFEEQLRRTK